MRWFGCCRGITAAWSAAERLMSCGRKLNASRGSQGKEGNNSAENCITGKFPNGNCNHVPYLKTGIQQVLHLDREESACS